MDLAYYESPPGVQLLHCISFEPDVVGGESFLVDGIAAADEVCLRYVTQHCGSCTKTSTYLVMLRIGIRYHRTYRVFGIFKSSVL